MYFSGGSPFTVNGQVLNFQDDAKAPPADGMMPWQELDADGYFGAVNIVVGKIEWDAEEGGEDIFSVARFLETEEISEAAFDDLIISNPNLSSANWLANKPDLDQSQFDTLSVAGLKFFVDEIRIGTTFSDVTGAPPSAPFEITSFSYSSDGMITLSWPARAGAFYTVFYSRDPGNLQKDEFGDGDAGDSFEDNNGDDLDPEDDTITVQFPNPDPQADSLFFSVHRN